MGIFVDKIFALFPIFESQFCCTACFDNGSFVTRFIAVKDGSYTKCFTQYIGSSQVYRSPITMSPLCEICIGSDVRYTKMNMDILCNHYTNIS